jgi:hypothetical protein
VLSIYFVFCLLHNQVCDSATRIENSFNARDIRLDIFGRHLAVGSPENKVSAICEDHSEMYLQTVANVTPCILNSKFTFLCTHLITFKGNKSRAVRLPVTRSHL